MRAALAIGLVTALYGATGVLEAARRALNVVFEVEESCSFFRRKATDIGFTLVLMALVLVPLILMIVGGSLVAEIFSLLGLGCTDALVWATARWPVAAALAMLVFAWVYYITPNAQHRTSNGSRPAPWWETVWLCSSAAFFFYVSNVGAINAIYGAFTAAVILLVWLWLTNSAVLFGAELNAEIERQTELQEGLSLQQTLQMPEKR